MFHEDISSQGPGERLFRAISIILDEAYKIQDEEVRCNGDLSFAKEFQSVKTCSVRGAGHDYAIMRLIEEKFDRVAVISQSADMMRMMKRQMEDRGIDEKKYELFDNNTDNLRGMKGFDAVIVNCSFMLSESKRQDIYNAFLHIASSGVPFFFIFIQ